MRLSLLLVLSGCQLFGLPPREKFEPGDPATFCQHDDVDYAVGTSRDDGCTTCTCEEDDRGRAEWSCSEGEGCS